MTISNRAFEGPVDISPEEIGQAEELLLGISEFLGMTLPEMALLMYAGIIVGAIVSMIRYRCYDARF